MRKSAFTLVELLVVVAIIALLIALLLPALNKAREVAIAAVCASNQRQAGTAAMTYAAEYKDFVFVQGNGGSFNAITQQRYRIQDGGAWSWPLQSFGYIPYASPMQACPSEAPFGYKRNQPYNTYGTENDINDQSLPRITVKRDPGAGYPRDLWFRRISEMGRPADRMFISDSWRQSDNAQYFRMWTGRSSWQLNARNLMVAGRHPAGGGDAPGNVLHWDGHVEALRPDDYFNLGMRIGWAGGRGDYVNWVKLSN